MTGSQLSRADVVTTGAETSVPGAATGGALGGFVAPRSGESGNVTDIVQGESPPY